jgi:uncharacterized membrane protein YcaP (DUF421 family)
VLETGDFGHVLLHIVVLFTVALIVVRLMGNRTVGQLSPFDFVIMVGIGDIIVSASMDKGLTLLSGIEGLFTLLLLQQILSYVSLKNVTLRKWVEGTPVTLIQDGKILRENFVKTHFNYDDLRQELHKLGMEMTDLQDIKLARLESCGVFSIIKTAEKEPLTRKDLETYISDIYKNPLTPLGQEWVKMEQFMSDVRELTEYVKNNKGLK